MATHTIGTREQWLAARRELLEAEKELTRRSDEVARHRQALPWVRIDKGYRFDTEAGRASLADLFKSRSQLLVYHFMFGPDYAAGCPSCSAIADGFNGFFVHLDNHDVAFWAVSRAPLAKLHPQGLAHTVAGHVSAESGHRGLLEALALEPLLSLGMRLGEGSGARLAVNILRSALECHAHMASFAEAGVSEKD